jgi:hypothetical protein
MSTSYHASSQLAQPISPTAHQLALNYANPLSSLPNTTTLLSTALQSSAVLMYDIASPTFNVFVYLFLLIVSVSC